MIREKYKMIGNQSNIVSVSSCYHWNFASDQGKIEWSENFNQDFPFVSTEESNVFELPDVIKWLFSKNKIAFQAKIKEGLPFEFFVELKGASYKFKSIEIQPTENGFSYFGSLSTIHQSKSNFLSISNEQLFHLSPDMICIAGIDGFLKKVNPMFEKRMGHSGEELLKQSFLNFIHLKDIENTLNKLASLNEENSNVSLINRYRKNSGEYIWLSWRISIDTSNQLLYCIARDISISKARELSLRKNAIIWNEAQRIANIGSWEFDVWNNILTWSNEMYQIHELVPGEFYPTVDSVLCLYSNATQAKIQLLYLRASKESKPFDVKLSITTKNGGQRWVRLIGKPIIENDKVARIFGVCQDITQAKQLEDNLQKAKEKAENAALLQAEFLSTMSHELRTPLNAVIGFTSLLLEDSPLQHQIEYLKTLKFSADNLLVLINDVLDYNKIEAGKIELEHESFDLRKLCLKIQQTMLPKAIERNNQLILSIPEQTVHFIKGDPYRLTQILTNLINNALKFTKDGTVTISVKELSFPTSCSNKVIFSIKDTGVGIPLEKQQLIFNEFSQVSNDTTRLYGGTGLGLSISKKLIELHGSKIQLQSKEGEGSEFSFTIEFQKTVASTNERIIPIPSSSKKDLFGSKILVIEDNKVNQLLAGKFIERWNAHVSFAGNGEEGLSKLSQDSYDLILMDMQMPIMDGMTTTRIIRNSNQGYQNIPILALSATAILEEKNKAYQNGISDYITKPFNPQELFDKISFYLNKPY